MSWERLHDPELERRLRCRHCISRVVIRRQGAVAYAGIEHAESCPWLAEMMEKSPESLTLGDLYSYMVADADEDGAA